MPTLLEHLAAKVAYLHAGRVYGRFLGALGRVRAEQQRALSRALQLVSDSDFGRRHDLHAVHTLGDLKRAVPLTSYEDYRPYIDRAADGRADALFSRGQRILMFATTSGTTARPKLIPVTEAFIRDYRRGWNTFGLKLLSDHPRAILRPILQCSGRYDAGVTPAGIPYGAITGLLALSQKRIVRRFYVGRPEIGCLEPPSARYYALMRLGMARDVSFAVTANPATLIQMARTADEHSEALIRDLRDGTLSGQIVSDPELCRRLSEGLRPDPERAGQLARLRDTHGALRPRDYWGLEFLACWTGGSMGHYLQRLADWWGPVPVRDIGLLASEGRVTIPLDDNTAVGVLDVTSGAFEFIPVEHFGAQQPETLSPLELEAGHDYIVVLTNTSGLVRYRLDDVVRAHGPLDEAPLLEFLYRAGRVASVAGEKLTENQVVAAVRAACRELSIPDFDFLMAPQWADPPYYRLSCPRADDAGLAAAVERGLLDQNEEYASRRKSNRLGPLQVRPLSVESLVAMDKRLVAERGSSAEQYKRPCLLTTPGEDERMLETSEPLATRKRPGWPDGSRT
jgi:hypothetical protein